MNYSCIFMLSQFTVAFVWAAFAVGASPLALTLLASPFHPATLISSQVIPWRVVMQNAWRNRHARLVPGLNMPCPPFAP